MMCNHILERMSVTRTVLLCLKCQSIDGTIDNNVIHVSETAMGKLRLLAKHKGISVDQCVEAFAMSCQPFGDTWVHPFNKGKK